MTGEHKYGRLTPWLMLALLLAGFVLVGCTSGSDTSDDSDNNAALNDDSDNDADNDDTSDDEGVIKLGSVDDEGTFTDGTIELDDDTLSSGDSATLSLRLVDDSGQTVADSVDVFFSSACTRDGLADIAPAVVTSTDGTIETQYTALGCSGTDTITATASPGEQTLTARTDITTARPDIASLAFVSASEPLIGLDGTGILPGQSTVRFRVTDINSQPVAGQPVDLALDSDVGGLSLSTTSARTNADGEVSTVVTGGTQATTVQVRATSTGSDGQQVSARSRTLAVTTGIADNDSFSLSADPPNIEGYDRDGVKTAITVRAADRFNNPVPDGTTVTFTSEGGAIPGSCETADGVCSVDFVSQSPRPADGRVTIRATAIGEESFVDGSPSNGRYDTGETYTDLPEAFRDDNEDGKRQSNEPYLDLNANGQYDDASGTYNGLLCHAGNECAGRDTINVRANLVVVLSESQQVIDGLPEQLDLSDGARRVRVSVHGRRGQVPPAGTVITATTSLGSIEGPSSYTVPPTATPGAYDAEFRIEPARGAGDGVLRLVVTTPMNVISRDSAEVVQDDG